MCIAGSAIADDGRYIVKFKDGLNGDATPYLLMSQTQIDSRADTNADQIFDLGGEVHVQLENSNSLAAEISEEKLNELKDAGVVEYYEVDPIRTLVSAMPSKEKNIAPFAESSPYGIGMVQADQVSDSKTANRKICITDTGYSGSHEDLRPHTDDNISGSDNDGRGNDTGDWFKDEHGHGTHVAGTIAAIGGNGRGVVGVNPSNLIGLHIVKVFDSSAEWGYGSDLIAAIDQCIEAGSDVISMSLGGDESSQAEEDAFKRALDAGVLTIAASGNSGFFGNNDPLLYPASYESVVSIGAVNSSKRVAFFSQKNVQVELSAPGVGVRSTFKNNRYSNLDGTSMAAPHVAGVAGLVWSHFTECSATQIRSALNNTAMDRGAAGRDNSYGYGVVQAKSAVDYLEQFGCEGK